MDIDTAFFTMAAMTFAAACVNTQGPVTGDIASPVNYGLRPRSAAVVCGLTRVDPVKYNGWAGDCPGCDVDLRRMSLLTRMEGLNTYTLLNEQATSFRFLSACAAAAEAVADGGLLLIYVSGHGGQVADAGGDDGDDGDEADRLDETLCLYDTQLSDDLLWAALCKVRPGVRVVFITDTCNSGSNFKAPRDYLGAMSARASRAPGVLSCSLLHIGGCADGLSSYGGADGGALTTALLETYVRGITWEEWFNGAKSRMPRNQVPVLAELGESFKTKEAMQ